MSEEVPGPGEGPGDRGVSGIVRRCQPRGFNNKCYEEANITDIEAVVQRYYGDRPVLQRIDDALRGARVDPEKPSHRDLWPFDQLHSRGIVATREHAERARIKTGMYVLDLGCGLGGSSRYLAADCGCRVAAIDLTPNFVEAARILTARCGLAERIEFRQANALAVPFEDGTFTSGRMPSP